MPLIKLTDIEKGREPLYINPDVIATAKVNSVGKTTITTTEVQRNNQYTVVETPEKIMELSFEAEQYNPNYKAELPAAEITTAVGSTVYPEDC